MSDNHKRVTERSNWPTVLGSNILYLTVLILMLVSSILFTGEAVSVNKFYLRTFILGITVIGLPPLIYLLYKRADISEVVRMNRIKPKEVLLIIGMAVFGYGVVIFINYLWMWIISHIGPPIPQPTPPVASEGQYIVALICVAMMPALVEEFLFRGVILRGYETMGRKVGIIMSGLLFALLHMNIASLPAIIFLGVMISYIVQRSNSIFTGMIYHFTNNAIAVTLVYASNTLLANLDEVQADMPADIGAMTPELFLAGLLGVAIIALFSFALFMLCFNAFKRSTRDRALKGYIETAKNMDIVKPIEMLPVAVALVVIAILLVSEVFVMINIG